MGGAVGKVCVWFQSMVKWKGGTQSNTFHTSADASINHISYINKIHYFVLYVKKTKEFKGKCIQLFSH
jgi:hypothetical protein